MQPASLQNEPLSKRGQLGFQQTLRMEIIPRVALFGSMLLVTGLIVGLV